MEYSRKSSLKWILTYLIIGIFAYGAIYYFFLNKNGGYSYAPQNSQTQNSNTKTADWKTYVDSAYGYEIKYPSDWVSKQYSSQYGSGGFIKPLDKAYDPVNAYITMSNLPLTQSSCSMPFSDFVKTAYTGQIGGLGSGDQVINSVEKVDSSNGVEAYETTWKGTKPCGGECTNSKEVVVIGTITYFKAASSCNFYQLTLYNDNYLDIYNQMISTFKFTK